LGRRVGVDVGDVRIGVAVSDPDGMLATPLETVAAGPDAMARLGAIVAEHDALECVVGLPIGLSGREGPAAAKVRAFCAELLTAIDPVPVRLFDERMSTMTADSLLRQGGRSSRTTRSIIDQAAATVILQTALDSERTRGSAPGESVLANDE
jgi:putative Holliday junction resolvase